MNDRSYIPVREACKRVSVSAHKIFKAIKNREIHYKHDGKRYIVMPISVHKWRKLYRPTLGEWARKLPLNATPIIEILNTSNLQLSDLVWIES